MIYYLHLQTFSLYLVCSYFLQFIFLVLVHFLFPFFVILSTFFIPYFYFCHFHHSLFLFYITVSCSLHPLLHHLHILVPSLCQYLYTRLSGFLYFYFRFIVSSFCLSNTVCLFPFFIISFPSIKSLRSAYFFPFSPFYLSIYVFQTLITVGLSPVRTQQVSQQAQDSPSIRHSTSVYNYTASCRCSQQLQHRTTCQCRECVNWRQVTRIKKITCHLQRGITRQLQREQRIP